MKAITGQESVNHSTHGGPIALALMITLVLSTVLLLPTPAFAAYNWTTTGGPGGGGNIINCFAHDASNSILYAGSLSSNTYSKTPTGAWTFLGAVGPGVLCLALDASNNILYAGCDGAGNVYSKVLPSGAWISTGGPGSQVNSLVHDASNSILYAGCNNGVVYSKTPAGAWTSTSGPSPAPVNNLAHDASNSILYAGCADSLVYSKTPTGAWTPILGPGSPVNILALDASNNILYAGCADNLVHSKSLPAGAWTSTLGPGSLVYGLVHDAVNNTLYAGCGDGDVYKNCLGGGGWFSTGSLATPASTVQTLARDGVNDTLYAGCNDTFVYRSDLPRVTVVSPASGPRGGNVAIEITCANTDIAANASARFSGSGITINSTDIHSPTKVTANVTIDGNATLGTRDVWVSYTDSGGNGDRTNMLSGAFTVTYAAPTVTGIIPSSGTNDGTVSITNLAGTEFRAGAIAQLIGPSGSGDTGAGTITATSVSVASSTKITCTFDLTGAAAGSYTVKVENDDGKSGKLAGSFNVNSAASTWYLAEGTTAWGYSCYITIENPNASAVTADITYMTGTGEVPGGTVNLPASSQTTVNPADTVPGADFSTLVECNEGKTIAVDRTMTWPAQGSGAGVSGDGHCSVGVTAPATTWYLAEGSSAWGFECWHLIQNPNTTAATCTLTYMIEGAKPVVATKTVEPGSRVTYNMETEIGQKDASLKVESDIPVIPERAMYKSSRQEGHDSIGTTTPAVDFYLAEGTTDYGFTTYVLVQNPQDTPTDVNVTYMTTSGLVPHPENPISMAANSRKTIRVNDYLPGSDFSTQVSGTQPIIAERAMYWGGDTETGEACHDSIGMSAPHTTFYLPDGQASNGYETYTLVMNPNDSSVEVQISYLTPTGTGNVVFTETVDANSRMTYSMADKGIGGKAAVKVTSKTAGKKIMVERAMYWNGRGAGTDTIGGFGD